MQPLQDSFPTVVADIVRRAPLSAEKVEFAWRAAVGRAIARVSTVHLSEDGVVEVHCADDHWRREIRRSVPIITARLATLLGEDVVRRVKVPGVGAKKPRRDAAHKAQGSGPKA